MDAIRLGIVKLNLEGDSEEVVVNRVKTSRKKADNTEDRERVIEDEDMKQIVKEFSDIFGGWESTRVTLSRFRWMRRWNP